MRYLEELPYLDMDKAAIAGASYGGYLVSWIFGHDLATKVRIPLSPALVTDFLPLTSILSSAAPSGMTASPPSQTLC